MVAHVRKKTALRIRAVVDQSYRYGGPGSFKLRFGQESQSST